MMTKGDLRLRFRDAIRARFGVEGDPLVFDRLLDDLAEIAIEHAKAAVAEAGKREYETAVQS